MDLYANNIVNGDKDGNFYPENNVTRAEFTKMAVSLFEIESSSTESAFTDVPADEWYAEYVAAAAVIALPLLVSLLLQMRQV